jgi:hypothetical protein
MSAFRDNPEDIGVSSSLFDPELPSSTAVFCDAPFIPANRLRGIAINHKRVKQLTLRRHWVTLATPRRGEDTRARIGAAVWTD